MDAVDLVINDAYVSGINDNKIKKYGELLEHPEVHLATAQLERVIAIARKADEIGQSAAEPTDEKCCRKVQRSEHTPNRDEVH